VAELSASCEGRTEDAHLVQGALASTATSEHVAHHGLLDLLRVDAGVLEGARHGHLDELGVVGPITGFLGRLGEGRHADADDENSVVGHSLLEGKEGGLA
jgi:hypothetical protein